ncbi:MAG: hypothetical protein ABSB52_00290 [Acidimicrobiales bacterium]
MKKPFDILEKGSPLMTGPTLRGPVGRALGDMVPHGGILRVMIN